MWRQGGQRGSHRNNQARVAGGPHLGAAGEEVRGADILGGHVVGEANAIFLMDGMWG